VDSNALQEWLPALSHNFFFAKNGKDWAMITAGMNDGNGMARRYHWVSDRSGDFCL